jgi:riboflavin biosynthesis pyrimidine reductase
MRQLLPSPVDDVDPVAVYGADDRPVRGRPWVLSNMIASVDGATAVSGRSGALGGAADHRVFAAVRSVADVVLVASGTVQAERYGPARAAAEVRAARTARGQAPVPAIAVVSKSLQLDLATPLFTEAEVPTLVVACQASPPDAVARTAEVCEVVEAGDEQVDLAAAVDALGDRGHAVVLCEGGPGLLAQLAGTGVLDEVCLTVAPWLVGGDSRRIMAGAPIEAPLGLGIASVLEEDGLLFLRYRRQL